MSNCSCNFLDNQAIFYSNGPCITSVDNNLKCAALDIYLNELNTLHDYMSPMGDLNSNLYAVNVDVILLKLRRLIHIYRDSNRTIEIS